MQRMAKKRRPSTSSATKIIRVPSAPAPIIRVAAPRAAPAKRRRGGWRRRARSVGGFVSNHNVDMAIGGAIVGLMVKQGWMDKLPAMPVVGRIGTVAILADYYSKHGGGDLARKVSSGAAVLAGYQLMQQGHIDGEDGDETAETGYGD